MRASIRKQFSVIFISLMAGTVFLCLIVNHMFLGTYYRESKIEILKEAYATIEQAAANDSFGSEEFGYNLNQICSSYNITICIMDANSQTKYVSINGGQELERRLYAYLFGFIADEYRVIEQETDYQIRVSGPESAEYLELYGRLESGISFVMRTPVESIRESAKLANRFFAYVGLFGAVLGGLIIWLVSRRITRPILELSRISEQMVKLDFEAKYHGKGKSEIDQLGENINKLSVSLEQAISDLKTANLQLQQDIARKEEIDEMRREFLANVSHELKTPIALIRGYAEGLKEGVSDDPESREFYCDVIMDEASKMNVMVKSLMTLDQLESGKDAVSMERFDIVLLIRNYLQSAEILAKQNDITVKMEDYPPIYVWADELKTEEVFMNYFSNAVHYCQDERIIDVSLQTSDGKVRISVFNTGNPIPEDAVEHIWEKFYKVDKARTREYGGSGVGLSIVKAIMEAMGQAYGVQNYDNGVLFWFELETVQ